MPRNERLEARKCLLPMNSIALMAYIIERCKILGITGLNVTKLQKLTYICYGTVLAGCYYRLCDESPEAGQSGPVFWRSIDLIKSAGLDSFKVQISPLAKYAKKHLPPDVKAMIDASLRCFGKFNGNQLANWTMKDGSPWVQDMGQIPDSAIAAYFEKFVLKAPAEKKTPPK